MLPLWMINPTLELVEEDFKSSFSSFVAQGACCLCPVSNLGWVAGHGLGGRLPS